MVAGDTGSVSAVPFFWSDQYCLVVKCVGEPESATKIAAHPRHKSLFGYFRDNLLTAAAGIDVDRPLIEIENSFRDQRGITKYEFDGMEIQ